MRLLSALVGLILLTVPAHARERVDLLLVLAIDVSISVDPHRWGVQRYGYAQALRDPEVLDAIRLGRHRRIAVTAVQWSGFDDQQVMVGWTIIKDAESARRVAARFELMPRKFNGLTSISDALLFSAEQFETAPYRSNRHVIDISGDGVHTWEEMVPVSEARDAVVAKGIVINGLPIGGARDVAIPQDIADYYEKKVIGGAGSFVILVADGDDLAAFTLALKKKLIREILADARK